MAEKSAENLVNAIDKSRDATMPRFLYGLGIRNVGETVAEILADHFGSVEAILDASEESIADVHGVGPIIAREIRAWADTKSNRRMVQRLLDAGIRFPENPAAQRTAEVRGHDLRFHRRAHPLYP